MCLDKRTIISFYRTVVKKKCNIYNFNILRNYKFKSIKVPLRITSGAELEALVAELTAAKVDLDQYELEITIG